MKCTNEIYKQQQQVVVEYPSSYEKLRQVGFDEEAATELAVGRSVEHIEKQITWLERRAPKRNPLGLLCRAIEEDWPEPLEKLETSQFSQQSAAVIFAKYFYAGYGRNDGNPTAEPSKNDLAASERYVKRLFETWPDANQVAKWGRALGHLTREKQTGNRNIIVSLVLALRSYGDQFFIDQHSARQALLEPTRAAARSAHEAKFKPAWLNYLLATERRYQEESAEKYAEFETDRASKRQEICVSPWKLVPVERALACFDSEEQRLLSFQAFFHSDVLDFWKWDKEHNQGTAAGKSSV
jgi:hypothetical protein